jgi:hypothetical protein
MISLQEILWLPGWHVRLQQYEPNIFLQKKFCEKLKVKVTSGDNETKTTQYQYELYICKKSISLAFKQAPYELCTEQVIIFNKGRVSKHVIFYNFHVPGCWNFARKEPG